MGSLRPDTQNFNRLLVSLGTVLVALALVGPWLFYRDMGALTITSARLGTLTPTARRVLTDRQAVVHTIQGVMPYVAVATALAGLILLIWGAKRMKEAQGWEDRSLRAGTREIESRVEPQTQEEKEQREQATDAANVLSETPIREPGSGDGEPSVGPSVTRTIPLPQLPNTDDLRRAKDAVLDHLRNLDIAGFGFQSEVKVVAQGRTAVLLDGLFTAETRDTSDIVVEVRAKSSRFPFLIPSFDTDRVIASVAQYSAATGRPAIGWLVVVLLAEDIEQADLAQDQGRLERALQQFGTASVIRLDGVGDLNVPLALARSGRGFAGAILD